MNRRPWVPLAVAGLTAVAAACARQGSPPGGPADRRPPIVVAVTPDTFARVEARDLTIRIQFDETVSENPSAGTLDQAVQVSPRTGEVEVRHAGDALEVKIEGGLRPGAVYRVSVAPVVQDRFGNTMLDPFEWVFTTGPEFEPNALAGEIWDRVTGEPVPSMSVFAVSDDSVPYVARTDSLGLFVMRYLPAGTYRLSSFDDRNRNDSVDVFEMQGVGDETAIGAADTLLTSFWVMVPDTTAPRLARGEKIDSTTLRLIFDDPLDPEQSLEGLVRGMYRDSGDTPGVLRALHPWQYRDYSDSMAEVRAAAAAEEAAARAAAQAAQDPAAAGDPADTAAAPPGAAQPSGPGAAPPGGARTPPARVEFLPDGQRIPETEVVLLLRGAIEGGSLYTVLLNPLTNISGLTSDEAEGTFRLPDDPRPPPADSAAADSTAVPDTAGVAPPDTGGVALPPPDTGGVALRRLFSGGIPAAAGPEGGVAPGRRP